MQDIMERYDRHEAVFYDSGYHLPDHLHQPNAPVLPLSFRVEYYGVPVQFRQYSTLS